MEYIEEVTQNVNNIIMQKIFKLPYFNDKNFKANNPSFKRILTNGKITYNKELSKGLYLVDENQLIINSDTVKAELILHETIHMLTADRTRNIIGYKETEEYRLFNEAATQWLTIKCIKNNVNSYKGDYYPYVNIFNKLVEDIGEEKIFSGFFEANINKMFNELTDEELNYVKETIKQMNIFFNSKKQEEIINFLNNIDYDTYKQIYGGTIEEFDNLRKEYLSYDEGKHR